MTLSSEIHKVGKVAPVRRWVAGAWLHNAKEYRFIPRTGFLPSFEAALDRCVRLADSMDRQTEPAIRLYEWARDHDGLISAKTDTRVPTIHNRTKGYDFAEPWSDWFPAFDTKHHDNRR
jgi:hypothetical protein